MKAASRRYVHFDVGGPVGAQRVTDTRVADLVQAGKIRVGVHSVVYKDLQSGELKPASVGIILLDIAHALGARIRLVLPIGHPTIPEMFSVSRPARVTWDSWA